MDAKNNPQVDVVTFVIERTYDAPTEKVWRAISEKDQIQHWFMELVGFKAVVGREFHMTGGPQGGRQYLHLCKILEVVEEKKLRYSWRFDGYEGYSEVTFELFPEGGKTRLRLTHSGLETFPASNPDFAKKNFAEGWTELIGSLLKKHVEVQH